MRQYRYGGRCASSASTRRKRAWQTQLVRSHWLPAFSLLQLLTIRTQLLRYDIDNTGTDGTGSVVRRRGGQGLAHWVHPNTSPAPLHMHNALCIPI